MWETVNKNYKKNFSSPHNKTVENKRQKQINKQKP